MPQPTIGICAMLLALCASAASAQAPMEIQSLSAIAPASLDVPVESGTPPSSVPPPDPVEQRREQLEKAREQREAVRRSIPPMF